MFDCVEVFIVYIMFHIFVSIAKTFCLITMFYYFFVLTPCLNYPHRYAISQCVALLTNVNCYILTKLNVVEFEL